jgi:hypothetical protein
MLIARGRPEDALAWVERGIDIEGKSSFGSVAAPVANPSNDPDKMQGAGHHATR